MGIYSLLRGYIGGSTDGSHNKDHFERNFFGVFGGAAGIVVSQDTLFQCSALICAARVISQGVAQVPFKLMLEEDSETRRTRRPARENAIYRLLSERPNDFQTSFTFRETMVLHAVLGQYGGFAFINRDRRGRVTELLPIAADDCLPSFDYEKYELTYKLHSGTDFEATYGPDQILHLHGPSWDGFTGIPALKMAREAIGLSSSMEQAHAKTYANGGRPDGVLSTELELSEDARSRMIARWKDRFGPGGKGGVALLDGSMKYTPMSLKASDGQLVENRKFQIEEIARYTMVFPQMLMQSDKASTYASAEQFFLAHVMHTLDPWMDRLEQEVKKSVVGFEGDNANLHPKLVREGLLRGATKDRAEYYAKALGAGGSPAWLTQNEVRELEDRNPIDDPTYDALPTPLNTQMRTPEGGDNAKD